MATLKISHTTKGNERAVVVVVERKIGKAWESEEELPVPDGGEVEVEVGEKQRVMLVEAKPKK